MIQGFPAVKSLLQTRSKWKRLKPLKYLTKQTVQLYMKYRVCMK
jgi:hypothetical protein